MVGVGAHTSDGRLLGSLDAWRTQLRGMKSCSGSGGAVYQQIGAALKDF